MRGARGVGAGLSLEICRFGCTSLSGAPCSTGLADSWGCECVWPDGASGPQTSPLFFPLRSGANGAFQPHFPPASLELEPAVPITHCGPLSEGRGKKVCRSHLGLLLCCCPSRAWPGDRRGAPRPQSHLQEVVESERFAGAFRLGFKLDSFEQQ